MIKGFFTAIGFLTVIPVPFQKDIDKKTIALSSAFFPLVGLFIGGLIFMANRFAPRFFPHNLSPAIVLCLWIIITRGLHLDGFVDTVDGLLGSRDREDSLIIMKDSRIGALGATALVMLILIKYLCLASITDASAYALLFSPCLARWSQSLSIFLGPYARQEGLGKVFVYGMKRRHFLFALITTVLVLFIMPHWKALASFLIVSLITFSFTFYLRKRLGGITGDTIGFMSEINEVMVLMVFLTL